MESPRADVELQVSEAGLDVQAGLCESSASLLAGNTAPTDAGHYYVDISTPAETLVLSRNEHI